MKFSISYWFPFVPSFVAVLYICIYTRPTNQLLSFVSYKLSDACHDTNTQTHNKCLQTTKNPLSSHLRSCIFFFLFIDEIMISFLCFVVVGDFLVCLVLLLLLSVIYPSAKRVSILWLYCVSVYVYVDLVDLSVHFHQ